MDCTKSLHIIYKPTHFLHSDERLVKLERSREHFVGLSSYYFMGKRDKHCTGIKSYGFPT